MSDFENELIGFIIVTILVVALAIFSQKVKDRLDR